MTDTATGETLSFQAEVSRLLDIVAHSLYSDKEIFLRELISNASDACDKLRYAALTKPELTAEDAVFKVKIAFDKKERTVTVEDNGIGMDRADLVDHLGTIAKSGTSSFLNQLSGDAKKDVALIGQFGVGFYSSYMVADRVEVVSRKAGDERAWRWISDGKGTFTVGAAERPNRGTSVTLHMKEGEDEFLDAHRLRGIVKRYSDHIQIPVAVIDNGKEETANDASALWARPKNEITEAQYKEFYRHIAHVLDSPWLTIHHRAEGTIEYTGLLYVPETKPFDLFHPDRKHRVKLYLKRVFITDDCKDLLPAYLRFLRGVVDTPDLPLNISREMLQKNPLLTKIRNGLSKKVLSELKKVAESEPERYLKFWNNFGAVLKEGLYEDGTDNRDTLLSLLRFDTTAGHEPVSLADYVGRMKPGQEAIYYINGDDLESLRNSPQIEGFAAKGIEVLLTADAVDDFWMPMVANFQGKPFQSVTRGGIDLSKIAEAAPEGEKKDETKAESGQADVGPLVAMFKLALGDAVKDVRSSDRLTDSPVCLVADSSDLDMRLERLLRQHKQLNQTAKRILEINPRHALILSLARLTKEDGVSATIEDAARLLLDQARILEGEPVPDPKAFARRMAAAMQRGFGSRVAA